MGSIPRPFGRKAGEQPAGMTLVLIALGLHLAGIWSGVLILESAGAGVWRRLQPLFKRFCRINSRQPDSAKLTPLFLSEQFIMHDIKRMRFPLDIILVCIRWYAAYPLSYRHLEEMMQERGAFVDH